MARNSTHLVGEAQEVPEQENRIKHFLLTQRNKQAQEGGKREGYLCLFKVKQFTVCSFLQLERIPGL